MNLQLSENNLEHKNTLNNIVSISVSIPTGPFVKSQKKVWRNSHPAERSTEVGRLKKMKT